MKNQHYEPVKAIFGTLRGRDAILLGHLSFNPIGNVLTIQGDVNGNLSTTPGYKNQIVDFVFTCSEVLAYTLVDSEIHGDDGTSCFDEVIGSKWLEKLGQDKSKYKHFVMTYYDHTLDVICDRYSLDLVGIKER